MRRLVPIFLLLSLLALIATCTTATPPADLGDGDGDQGGALVDDVCPDYSGERVLYFPVEDSTQACHSYGGHVRHACDIRVPLGTKVGSPIDGTVTTVRLGCSDNYTNLSPYQKWSGYYCNSNKPDVTPGPGNFIIITSHDQRIKAHLLHLMEGSIKVAEGDTVCAGQLIAQSGASGGVLSTSGGSTGKHLHIDATVDDSAYCPDDLWLDKSTKKFCAACPTACDDTEAASAQIDYPTEGLTIQGGFTVQGSASDPTGLKKVTLAVNWNSGGTDKNQNIPICDSNCGGIDKTFAVDVDPALYGVPTATSLTLAIWVRDTNDQTYPPLAVHKITWLSDCLGQATQGCGNCGTQSRVCNGGQWSAWSACMNPGDCAPGAVQACGNNGSQSCTAQCKWGSCQPGGPTCGKQVSWLAKAPLSAPDPTTVSAVLDGQIHVFGWSFFLRHRVFNPSTNSWVQKADLPFSAGTGWAGAIGSTLYAFGEGIVDNAYPMAWTEATDTWSTSTTDPWPRDYPVGAVINGKVYLATGWSLNKSNVNVYDPGTNVWTDLAPIPALAGGANSGLGLNGKLYVFGVTGGNGNPTQAWVYDPAANAWQQLASLPQTRSGSRPIVYGGNIWLLGGHDSVAQNSIYVYDVAANMWCTGSTLPKPLTDFAVQQVNGKIYLVGGYDVNAKSVADVWEGTIQ